MTFHTGNKDGKHYWLTPPEMMRDLQLEFNFDHDACPYPKPDNYDGLTDDWGNSTYVNPPFGSIMHEGKKKGPTAWVRKALAEHKKGKSVVLVFPTDKWIHYLIKAGAELRSYGDVRWHATEDGSAGKGIGRFTMAFILRGDKVSDEIKPEIIYDMIRRYDSLGLDETARSIEMAKEINERFAQHISNLRQALREAGEIMRKATIYQSDVSVVCKNCKSITINSYAENFKLASEFLSKHKSLLEEGK